MQRDASFEGMPTVAGSDATKSLGFARLESNRGHRFRWNQFTQQTALRGPVEHDVDR
jgi:hypothetical protein